MCLGVFLDQGLSTLLPYMVELSLSPVAGVGMICVVFLARLILIFIKGCWIEPDILLSKSYGLERYFEYFSNLKKIWKYQTWVRTDSGVVSYSVDFRIKVSGVWSDVEKQSAMVLRSVQWVRAEFVLYRGRGMTSLCAFREHNVLSYFSSYSEVCTFATLRVVMK